MRRTLIVAVALIGLTLAGCCGDMFKADRVKEINDQWFKIYNQDRNPTSNEVALYNAMSDEDKAKWQEAGKPVSRPLPEALMDAASDLHQSIDLEIKAKKGE